MQNLKQNLIEDSIKKVEIKEKPLVFQAFQVTPAGELYEQEFLSVVASVETHSEHWMARQVVKTCRHNNFPIHSVIGFKEFPGEGLGGAVEVGPGVYRAVVIGKLEFLQELGLNIPELLIVSSRRWTAEGATVVYAGWDGWIRGILKFK